MDRVDGVVAPGEVAVRGGEAGGTHHGGREYRYHTYFVGTAEQLAETPAIQDIPGVGK